MSYYTKITKAGLAAITAAMNNNSKVPITYMAFGDGNGSIPEPDENATSLVNEVYRVGVNKVEVHKKNPNWLVCEAIIPSAVGGFNIREVALYDSTGNTMLAIASYPPTYKPTVEEGAAKIQTIRIVIQVDNSGIFKLIIDPDVVLATRADLKESLKSTVSYFNEISDIPDDDVFEGRTVYVKGCGLLTFQNGNWVLEDEYSFSRKGEFINGIVLNSIKDVIQHNGMYYFYKGNFPHVISENSPNEFYQCIGLLNGYPLNHIRNWGIVDNGLDQFEKMKFALLNSPCSSMTSDGEIVRVSKVDITTNFNINTLKFENINFAPYFSAPELTKDYLFNINYSETYWNNIKILPPSTGKKINNIFNIKESIRHLFERIQCSCNDSLIDTFFDLGLVKESGFVDLRIDIDTQNKTGTIFKLQSCVNNWISGGMYGYGQFFINCDPESYPDTSYKSEGILINNTIVVHFENPLNVRSITALQINNSIFDFCREKFFEFTLGSHSMITNCWFANTDDSSIIDPPAIVASNMYDGICLANNSFINNNGNNSTPLFSINPSSNANSQIYANQVESFSEGVILNCDYFANMFTNKSSSHIPIINSRHKIQGPETEFENLNQWSAGSIIHELLFKNKYTTSKISVKSGAYSDISSFDFQVSINGELKDVLILQPNSVKLPSLPNTADQAGTNGLYAGPDGVIKINRN